MAVTRPEVDANRPGDDAAAPWQIPAKGWWQISRRAWQETKDDHVMLVAAGVAFYGFLSLFPAMIAAVTVYGLVSDPETVARQSEELAEVLPADAASLVTGQLTEIVATPGPSLGLGLAVALALALWSASAGVGNLITAINLVYDTQETRGFVMRKGLALLLTLGAIVFAAAAVALVAVIPALLTDALGGGVAGAVLGVGRWLLLVVLALGVLAVLYRVAPERETPQWRWVSVGAVVATVIWLVASVGFSVYVEQFGSYAKTYGALAGVAILLLWLWLSVFAALFGAEVNAEAERQAEA